MNHAREFISIISRAFLGLSLSVPLALAGSDETNLLWRADTPVVSNNNKLVWMPDGSTPSIGNCAGGKKSWIGALDYVACLNANGYLGYSDWRLPAVGELLSLGTAISAGYGSIAATRNANGFANMKSAYYWASSGDSNKNTSMVVDMLWDGQVHAMNKSSKNHVLVVRPAGN